MTREELKRHCENQVEWAKYIGEEPYGKIYEEHKLILELLEQEDILDKIRAEIIELRSRQNVGVLECLDIIDKYKNKVEV